MSNPIDSMVKGMNDIMGKSMIKAAIAKFIPADAKPHIPKLIDLINIGASELSNYLGKDDKFIVLRKDGNGKTWFIVVDTKKPFLISKDENYFEPIKCVEIGQLKDSIINEYVMPHVPHDSISEIGKLDINSISSMAQEMTKDLK